VFVHTERTSPAPLIDLSLFRIREFSAANATTFFAYAAIGTFFFLLVLQLQVVAGWSPLAAGASSLPVTGITLGLSRLSGRLAQRIGPRPQMTLGPVLCAAGCVLALRITSDAHYLTDVLPAVVVFGLGLATLVAPLTATALSAVPDSHAGVASGFNNAVARTGSLLAIAAVPTLTGITGDAIALPQLFAIGFRTAMAVCAGLLITGSVVAAMGIPRRHRSAAHA
jgi:MFS family permease